MPFTGNSQVCIESILVTGNKKTKEFVITRELTIDRNDCFSANEINDVLEENRILIYNTGLFNKVELYIDSSFESTTILIISVEERWYLFPIPYLALADRNFNVWYNEKNADPERLIYGMEFQWDNFRGRDERLYSSIKLGFSETYTFYYLLPTLGQNLRHGLQFGFDYFRKRRIPYITRNDKLEYIEGDDWLLRTLNAYAIYKQFIDRKRLHYIQVGYNEHRTNDSIIDLNPNYIQDPIQQSIFFEYKFVDNHRDIYNYPLDGHYVSLAAKKDGIGVFGDLDWFSFKPILEHYQPLGSGFYLSNTFAGKISFPFKQYYVNKEALGYDQYFVRGYEYYVIDGHSFWMNRNTLRKRLFKFDIHIPFLPKVFNTIPLEFYGKTYADIGQAYEETNDLENELENELMFGYGAGIDLVTYYDWVFRLEYSRNLLEENGLFLHFTMDLTEE